MPNCYNFHKSFAIANISKLLDSFSFRKTATFKKGVNVICHKEPFLLLAYCSLLHHLQRNYLVGIVDSFANFLTQKHKTSTQLLTNSFYRLNLFSKRNLNSKNLKIGKNCTPAFDANTAFAKNSRK